MLRSTPVLASLGSSRSATGAGVILLLGVVVAGSGCLAGRATDSPCDVWRARLAGLRHGMTSAEVHAILPPVTGVGGSVRGGRRVEQYDLDGACWVSMVFSGSGRADDGVLDLDSVRLHE
jgi:hypothetical protein